MAKFKTQGSVLQVNNGTAQVNIGEVKSVSFSGGTAEEYDATVLASTAKETITGFTDFGETTINLLFDPNDAGQKFLKTESDATNTRQFKLLMPSTAGTNNVLTWNIALKNFLPNFDAGIATATVTGKNTGSLGLASS